MAHHKKLLFTIIIQHLPVDNITDYDFVINNKNQNGEHTMSYYKNKNLNILNKTQKSNIILFTSVFYRSLMMILL